MGAEDQTWRPYPADVQIARGKLVNGLFDLRAKMAVALSLAKDNDDSSALKELCGIVGDLIEVLGDTFLYSQDALLKEGPHDPPPG